MRRHAICAGVIVAVGLACGGRAKDPDDSVESVMEAPSDESTESEASEAAPDEDPFAEQSVFDTGDGLLICEWSAPDSDPMSTLCGAAINILMAYCADCHSPGGVRPTSAGPTDIGDWALSSREGYVRPCAAEQSPIITTMRENEVGSPNDHMLPFPVSAADIDVVVQMIEFDCTDEEKRCAADPAEPGCAEVLLARQARQGRTN